MKVTLEQYKTTQSYMVHWGDMDAAKHVNNLVYLRWAESARIHYFEQMQMDTSFGVGGIGPILAWQDCKYIFPMTHPDTALVGIRVYEIKEDRFFLETAIFSQKHQRLAALSHQSIVPYSYADLKKVALPQAWLNGIKQLEGDESLLFST